jgi:lipid II:glycine glycyltransferase (peptidoglycan interpeptide bridge formation enzyme)
LDVVVSSDPGADVLHRWDALVDATAGADVAQLSAWARVRGSYGFTPVYVIVRNGPDVVGGAQVLCRDLPMIGTIGYVPHGPVIGGTEDVRPSIVAAVNGELAHLARTRFKMLFIQPAKSSHDVGSHLASLGFRPSQADLAPAGSVLTDLSLPRQQLFGQLGRSVRRAVRRAPGHGIRIRVGDHNDVSVLAHLMAATAQHRGFDALTEAHVEEIYAALAPTGSAAIFVGEVAGKPVAACLLTICGGTVVQRLTGMDRSDMYRPLRVPAVMEWRVIMWAKRRGYEWYDFGGLGEKSLRTLVDDEPGDPDSWDGADRFKLSFGGVVFRYPSPVEWIRPSALRYAYDLSRRFPAGRSLMQRAARRLRTGREAQSH